ncbi:zeatin O-glucosyltransferase-like [Rhododendron vialii]|uniref:zeatin O-glucosyltransferase-like n=1 Tax=Rhododendron vialii TaxID=182163 RepID=UPI00266027D5|nr:zeatin O-glucosyltransferase-like [Rhododendron vialii]
MSHQQNHGQGGLKQAQVAVVMVPLPAQGHLNQLLHLSRLVSAYNIPVHYVASATHNCQAKLRVHGWNLQSASNIHFHEFPTPHFHSPPPNPNASVKFPSHLQPSFDASSHLRDPFAKLLHSLLPKSQRIIVIHDSLMSSVVQDLVLIPHVESYSFHSVSAFAMFFYFWEALGRPFPVELELLKDLPSLEGCFTTEFRKFVTKQHKCTNLASGRLYNTCKAIEGPFLDLLAKEEISGNKKQWALGPVNPVEIQDNNLSSNHAHKCLEWLDKQAPNSVIYVSFGTTTSLSDAQIKELALGLEKSEQKFIWVLRDADTGNIFSGEGKRGDDDQLPKGYEERVEGRGMVVRGWAPQLEILGHPSTGGFMSHCGWNSCMESITMGVPIAAWPMHSDQPRNTVLITKLLKIGLVVKDWARREDLVESTTVERAIRMLMGSREGEEMRRRAAELGGAVGESAAEGGGSRSELDSFISHITR